VVALQAPEQWTARKVALSLGDRVSLARPPNSAPLDREWRGHKASVRDIFTLKWPPVADVYNRQGRVDASG
jgi:hypothetical protein